MNKQSLAQRLRGCYTEIADAEHQRLYGELLLEAANALDGKPPARGGGQETHTCQRCGTVKPKGEPCIHFDEGARAANRGGLG